MVLNFNCNIIKINLFEHSLNKEAVWTKQCIFILLNDRFEQGLNKEAVWAKQCIFILLNDRFEQGLNKEAVWAKQCIFILLNDQFEHGLNKDAVSTKQCTFLLLNDRFEHGLNKAKHIHFVKCSLRNHTRKCSRNGYNFSKWFLQEFNQVNLSEGSIGNAFLIKIYEVCTILLKLYLNFFFFFAGVVQVISRHFKY